LRLPTIIGGSFFIRAPKNQGDGSRKPTFFQKTPRGWVKKTHIFETFLRHDHRFTAQPHDIETKFGLEEADEGLISLGWLGSDNIEI
jgi:hypothetical protein